MKPKETVERRLRTLRIRYAKKFILASQKRLHTNCVYNIEHSQTNWWSNKRVSESVEMDIAPHHSVTLLVIQPEQLSPRLCMYGAEDPAHWPGDICDSDDMSKRCKWFKPRYTVEQAKQKFFELLQDDKYVYDNFQDVASLQWVLEDRLYNHNLSWWERLIFWLKTRFIQVPKPMPQLPPIDLPEGIWDDDPPSDS